MTRIEEDDISEFILGSLIIVIAITVSIVLIIVASNTFTSFENKETKLAELKSKSDSLVLLTTGRYAQEYYTTKSTIKTTDGGTCISFKDNSTNQHISACTQFIIKAN